MRRAGYFVVASAVLVSGPRLAAVFLQADGLLLPASVEFILFGATGVASALCLTLGNAYLAHVLAEHHAQRGLLWHVLFAAWCCFLVGAIILTAPHLVAGVRGSDLAEVLNTSFKQWVWATTAVLVVEMLAAAAMASIALDGASFPAAQGYSVLGRLTNAMVSRLEASIAQAPMPAQPQQTGEHACPNAQHGCSYAGTEHGLRAHKRWCEFAPAHNNGRIT